MFKLFLYSLKTLFRSKVFIAVFSVILLLIGTTYTLLQSTNASFQNSSTALLEEHKLHDVVIKSNIKTSSDSVLEIEAKSPKKIEKDGKEFFSYDVEVIEATGEYEKYQNEFYSNVQVDNQDENEAVKIIEDRINNLVLNNLTEEFSSKLQKAYENEIFVQSTESLTVKNPNEKKIIKVVYHDSQKGVNEIQAFKGKSSLSNYWDEAKMEGEFSSFKIGKQGIDRSKNYKWTKGVGPQVNTLIDPTSYEVIVSPSFAKKNNIDVLNERDATSLISSLILFENNNDIKKELISQHSKNIIKVGEIPYVVVGIGTRPDFAYPIVDLQNVVPDVENQAIVFVNKNGFARTWDSFRGNFHEGYFSLRFKEGVTSERQNQIKSEIKSHFENEDSVSKLKDLPKNVIPNNFEPLTMWNDRNDQSILAQERVVFLKDFQRSIATISSFLTTSLIVFGAFIIIFSFRVLISNRISKLSTLIALGYTKNKIAWNMGFATSLIMLIPTFLGYIFGLLLQDSFGLIFANFWTIPTETTGFSWNAFIVVFVFPLVFLIFLIWIITYFTLGGDLMNMINNTKKSKNNFLGVFMKPFANFGIKMKYGIALTFKNFTKVIVVFLASTFSMISMIVAFSNIGKASDALQKTSNIGNYVYKVDLFSPTKEGGFYQRVNKESLAEVTIKTFEDNYDSGSDKPYFYVPNINDQNYSPIASSQNFESTLNDSKGEGVSKVRNFLKNQIQVQYLMENTNVVGSFAWQTAKSLMPENQLNLSEKANKEIIDQVEKQTKKNFQDLTYLAKKNNFLKLLGNEKINPYFLTYNSVLTNANDETYSYVSANINNDTYKISGIKENSKYINLSNSIKNKLKNFAKPNVFPIVINKFISEKHKLDIGNQFSSEIDNNLERNFKNFKNYKKTFEVVGIINSYDNKGIFTLEEIAQKVLGIHEKDTQFFNGVFTKNQGTRSALINSVPLYSPSGIYVGSDSILQNDWNNALDKIIESDQNPNHGLLTKVFENQNDYKSQFIAKYTTTPYVSLLENVEWSYMNEYAFRSTSQLVSRFLMTLEIILICVSFLFATIISVILITSNRKRIATLWALGYRRSEIIRIFLTTQVLPLCLATIFAIPISIAFLAILRAFVMGFGNILIPFGLTIIGAILPILIISSIFILAIVIGILSLGSKTTLEAFKNE